VTTEVERSVVVHGDAKTRTIFGSAVHWALLSRRVEGCPHCGGTLLTSGDVRSLGMIVQQCCRCSYTEMGEMNAGYGAPSVR